MVAVGKSTQTDSTEPVTDSETKDLLSRLSSCPKHLLKEELVTQLMGQGDAVSDSQLVLTNKDVNACLTSLTGGKGSSLMILNLVEGVTVPEFFCVSTRAFQKATSEMLDIGSLQAVCDEWWDAPNGKLKDQKQA